jgi:hypothetical protein
MPAISAFIVGALLNPASDKADSETVFESFDRQRFQVGHDAVLKMRGRIFRVKFQLPDAT